MLCGKVLRRQHLDHHVLIAAAILPEEGDAAALEAKGLARLGALGYLHVHGAVQGRHLHRGAQRRLHEGDGHLHHHVIAAALEELVGLDGDIHVEIAVVPAVGARITAPLDPEPRALIHALRYGHIHLMPLSGMAGAMALLAGVLDNLARAAAAGAGGLVYDAAEGGVLHLLAHARALAVRALLCVRAALAMAFGALLRAGIGDLHLLAEGRLLEGKLQLVAEIRAPLRPNAARAAAAATAEEHVENIVEAAASAEASKATAKAPEAATASSVATHAVFKGSVAELVIGLLLLRILQDLVGLIDLLELLLGCLRVIAIEVRMILAGHFLVGLFYLRLARALLDAKDFIVIAFFAHALHLFTNKRAAGNLPLLPARMAL